MPQLKQMTQGAPVHERKIEIRSYPAGPQQIIVEGWLKDDRRVGGFHWDGRPRPPGVVHRLGIRLLVGGWPLTIQEAEAEMVEIPHELCRTLEESLNKIIGLTSAPGFSDQVRRLLGGLEGCSHLTHLLLAMAPAILHGFWTQLSKQPRPVPQSLEEVQGLSYLVNSCRLWSEDGPLLQMVRETIEKAGRENPPE
jgi:hypothetical protein